MDIKCIKSIMAMTYREVVEFTSLVDLTTSTLGTRYDGVVTHPSYGGTLILYPVTSREATH